MASGDMDHMKFLEVVVKDDLAVLGKKEATYQGSWKRSGGRSAWFMIKRLLDRLNTMATRPETPPGFSMEDLIDALGTPGDTVGDCCVDVSIVRYLQKCYIAENIFALIRSGPGGEDGTPLAVMRDIRRYLILVEAEMMSRGVCKPEMVDVNMTQARSFGETITVDQKTANELVALRDAPHKKLRDSSGDAICTGFFYFYQVPDGPRLVGRVLEIGHVNLKLDLGSSIGHLWVKYSELQERVVWPARPIPEDGSHHHSLAPWTVGYDWRLRHGMGNDGANVASFGNYWRDRSPGRWVLEPAVDGVAPPPQAAPVYLREGTWYVLNIADCPPDARDFYPYLEREMNTVTLDESPDWVKNMYTWHDSETKWRLNERFMAWARD